MLHTIKNLFEGIKFKNVLCILFFFIFHFIQEYFVMHVLKK